MPKVMLVEDSPTQALRTRIALESQGFEVAIVAGSADAIPTAREERPDVVLSDVRMPGMDGFELVRAIHAEADLAALPIVLISATVKSEEDRAYALEQGATDLIAKGLPPAELAGVLTSAMA